MIKKVNPGSILLYGIASIPPYSLAPIFKYGHAKDHFDLFQANFSLIMEKIRNAPLYYELHSESITHVVTLKPTLNYFSLIVEGIKIVLDGGFLFLFNFLPDINTIGLEPSIGFLHEIAPSKTPLVYDLQELFRYVIDYSVIQILEYGLKKSDFITTENYHIRLRPETAKRLIETIKENFNQRYLYKGKKHTLENIMFENITEFSKFISDNSKKLEFTIPEIMIKRNDDIETRERILSIDPEERKKLKINKSTLWYQQKKIKEGKQIKVYEKTRVKI